MSDWIDEQNVKIEEAERELGSEVMATILDKMSRTNKTSTAAIMKGNGKSSTP
jgi:hypothetical protein